MGSVTEPPRIPTLMSLAAQAGASAVESQSAVFYKRHAVCSVYKDSFTRQSSLFTRIWEALFGKQFTPAEETVRALPNILLLSTPDALTPRILAALDRLNPAEASDSHWETLLKGTPRPIFVSCKNSYIVKYLLTSFQEAGRDVRRIPQSELSLFTENAAAFKGLELGSASYLTDSLLMSLAEFIPHFSVLSLTGRSYVTASGIDTLIKRSPALEHFHPGNTLLTPTTLSALANNCTKLKSLDLRTLNSRSTIEQVKAVIARNPHIETLKLGQVQGLTDEMVVAIVKILPSLRHLEIARADSLTPKFIDNLFRIKSLDSLSLNDCSGFTDSAISEEAQNYSLSHLEVKNCPLSDAGLVRLKKKFPYLS